MKLKESKRRYRTKFKQKDDCGNLICYCCKKYLSEDLFDNNNARWFRDNKDYRCKLCKQAAYNKKKLTNRGKKDLNRILLERWHGIKDRARASGYVIDFGWEVLKEIWENQNGICALSGIEMTYEMFNGRVHTNVSVDKIDCYKQYSKNNIQLVCMAANQMKSDMPFDKLIWFCKNIIKYNEDKNKNKKSA